MRCIVHIGANKAASTTLQRALFSKHPSIRYLGEDSAGHDEHEPLLASLLEDDDIFLDYEQLKRLFDSYQSEEKNGQVFVYSNEDIMTSPVPSRCARRLKYLVPDAQILIIARNQLSAISSWYASHGAFLRNVPRTYWRRHVSLDSWLSYCFSFFNKSPLIGFCYGSISALYGELFGKENVHVLLFEDLVRDRQVFIWHLAKILYVPSEDVVELLSERHERKRVSAWVRGINRARSRCLPEVPLNWLTPLMPKTGGGNAVALPPKWRTKIEERFRDENLRLADMFGLDLEKYEYPL